VTPAHDDLKQDAAAYALGVLEAGERAAFETHLAGCAECAAEVRDMRLVAGALPYAVPQVSPPPSLRARILGEIAATAPAPALPGPVLRERRGSLPQWLSIAAMLVLGVAMFMYAQRMQARVSSLESQLRDAQARATEADRLTAEARNVAFRAQSAMGVFAAPDVARIDLAGQPVAINARARALWSRQRGMVFTVSNLPALPAGRVYQVWVVTAQAPVSAGLLTPDAAGGGSVYYETPVDILPPTAVAVTLEPAGGVPAPTGAMYLVGTPAPL
jgi:anti-sigma-K factor RskA